MHFSNNVFVNVFIILIFIIINCTAQYSYSSSSGGYGNAVDNIPIGLITDQYNEEFGIVFDQAIEVANEDLNVPLISAKDEVNYGDSFQAYGRLCKMLETGVGAVFGPSSKHTAAHLMTVCDAKDIPYIYSHMSESDEGFNLHPHPTDLAKALHAIITAFDWTRFIFLYESAEYLSILNGLMAQYNINDGPIITVLRYDQQLSGNYKPVLRRIRKSTDNRIVVVGSTDTMPEFLRQAQQVGIINEDYQYIIGNLDFHAFDLEEYKYSEANITGFRMFSAEQPEVRALMAKLDSEYDEENYRNGSCYITVEMALTYDAVQLFAETTKHLAFRPAPLNCSERSDSVRDDGSTFKNYMHSLDIDTRTLTGRIYFDGNVRKGYSLDVIELQPSGIVKVGTWDEVSNFTEHRFAQTNSMFDNFDNSLVNKTFVVLIAVGNLPYANLVESHKQLDGNSQYEGYGVELIMELADKLGFNYTFKSAGNDYGSFNRETNETTGWVKMIMQDRADLGISDLTITSERQEVVDFTIPFMNLGISILFLKPTQAPPALFSFMAPFSSEVWMYLGIAFFSVSLSFFMLGRLSPTEWDNPYPCVEEPTELENQFTIGNSLWFTTGALLQQGSEIAPRALSVRTVASIWWFFVLIIVSSYTANLAAFLTVENPTSLIDSVEDLAKNKDGVVYGAKRTGSTRNFFLTSEDERFKRMNVFMNKHPELLLESNEAGVDEVDRRENYAFLMESTTIEYHTMRKCRLKKIGDTLDEKGYGIMMRKGWPYRDKFNNAILEMQEQGVLAKMKNKWWKEVGAGICTTKTEKSETDALHMENLDGVYFVLIVGSFLAVLYGIISWVCFVLKKARHYHVPFKDAFKEEFKIVIDFHMHTRVLKSSASVYSRSRNSSMSIESIEPDTNTIEK